MYEAFYGLNEKPFNLTPDPRFLYLSTKHKEAFAHLLYGIRNRSGFVMVSGEIGTGKTTICRSLLKQLDPDTEVAFIFNPKLSPIDLLKSINADFGIASKADTVRGLINELNDYLLQQSAKGKNCVLIIDEAQNLGTETLEQVRLLSNLETETEKLLQIVLIGQPELAQKLELPELRQLNQRITARYHLGTLSAEETLHYIAFRLRVAGGRKKVMFTRRAIRAVHKISQGTPRVINALCDRALLIGYTRDTRTITPKIVKKAAEEIQGDYHVRVVRLRFGRLLPASALATSAAIVLLLFLLANGPLPDVSEWVAFARAQVEPVRAPAAPALNARGNDPADLNVSDLQSMSHVAVPPDESGEPARVESGEETAPASRGVVEAASRSDAPEPVAAEPALSDETSEAVREQIARRPETAEAVDQVEKELEPAPHQGVVELVRAWNLAMLEAPPAELSAPALERFAGGAGLRVTELSSSIDQLVAINLPVLLQLRQEEEAEPSWVALTKAEGDALQLVGSDGTAKTLSAAVLRERYAGTAYCLWEDPQPGAEPLRAMVRNVDVQQLQNDLRSLGLFDGALSGVYDAATIDAVTRIQRAMGLAADGIVGPQTRMVLCSWLDQYETPHLTPRAFSESAQARVLASQGMVSAKAGVGAEIEPLESIPLPESVSASSPESQAGTGARPQVADVSQEIGAEGPQPEREGSGTIPNDGLPQAVQDSPVNVEELGAPAYVPQLDSSRAQPPETSVTQPWGPAGPIVPRSEEDNSAR